MTKIISAVCMFVFVGFTASEAFSCSCGVVTQREEFEKAAVVFVGKYVGPSTNGDRVQFKVEKVWKGARVGEIVSLVYWELEGCDYDLNLVGAKSYLIYAVPSENISVDCGRSRAIHHAWADIKNMDKVADSVH